MKLLLASAGVTNPTIRDALVEMLGKPISEASALAVPTASWGHPWVEPARPYEFISGREPRTPMTELGWKSIGVLELTALPTIDRGRWTRWVDETDVFLVGGGDAVYLAYWMRESGLADLLPTFDEKVWVGLSAGSMVLTPRVGPEFLAGEPITGTDETLGVVDFSIFPHLEHPELTENTMAAAETWAERLGGHAYAIDDATAIRVVDGEVDVVSEGTWRYFPATG
ncbi:Type 1 glutamine amidotransferase-like domain-containing protein [Agromyces mangrovi Wang et al. 2018]|uniref:Type 1 glutamine amidotransferase-like domain-containing protein n=1 Tax=Agromyces mangrovi TaxID=1858653 RepID=UPI00257418ED|nr:Type 1 glutamine amidotransferase-like domain-containing protein [Agromyces mangrovi]BDZ63321.1 peptidase E [Agromyces mangrovi]